MESLLSGSGAKAKGLQVHERNRKESGYGWSKPVDNSKVGGWEEWSQGTTLFNWFEGGHSIL